MTQIIPRLLLLVSLLVTSSQAGCYFRPYDNVLELNPTAVVSQIGYVSSFEDRPPGYLQWYELYNIPSRTYFYTADAAFRNSLLGDPNAPSSDWINEFTNMWVFNGPGPERVELRQFTYPATGAHVWATDPNEWAFLSSAPGWKYDGVNCYLPTSGTQLYRYCTPDLST